MASQLFVGANQVANYSRFRPRYPQTLYDVLCKYVSPLPSGPAVDVACGSGQATVQLAKRGFHPVIGVDCSRAQLEHAGQSAGVEYIYGTAETLPFEEEQVALITVAQGAHWFDIPQFYSEVNRVLAPGGTLALWTYAKSRFSDPFTENIVMGQFDVYLQEKSFWDPKRTLVDNQYQDIPFAFPDHERIDSGCDITFPVNSTWILGYVRSWSAYESYRKSLDNPDDDFTNTLADKLQERLGNTTINVTFPVTLMLCKKPLA